MRVKSKIKYKKNTQYLLLLLLVSALILLKTWRGLLLQTEQEGGVWNVIQVFLVGTGVICLLSKSKPFLSFPFIKVYIAFFLYIWFFSAIWYFSDYSSINRLFRFIVVPYGLMSLLTVFTVGLKGNIRQYVWVLLATYLILFYIMFTKWSSYNLSIIDSNGAVADVYYLIGLLPIVLLYIPQKYKIIPFLLAFIVAVMSSKRGALIATIVMLIVYFLIGTGKSGEKRNIILRVFAVAAALVVAYIVVMYFVERYNLSIFDRIEKLEDDGGSGRSDRWALIIHDYTSNTNILNLLFGNGTGSVIDLTGGHAHNDFLEFLYEYGIVAFILYILFDLLLIKETIRMYRKRYIYAKEFACSVSVAICMSLFSFYAVDCTHITSCSICQGLILADWYKFKKGIQILKQ